MKVNEFSLSFSLDIARRLHNVMGELKFNYHGWHLLVRSFMDDGAAASAGAPDIPAAANLFSFPSRRSQTHTSFDTSHAGQLAFQLGNLASSRENKISTLRGGALPDSRCINSSSEGEAGFVFSNGRVFV